MMGRHDQEGTGSAPGRWAADLQIVKQLSLVYVYQSCISGSGDLSLPKDDRAPFATLDVQEAFRKS